MAIEIVGFGRAEVRPPYEVRAHLVFPLRDGGVPRLAADPAVEPMRLADPRFLCVESADVLFLIDYPLDAPWLFAVRSDTGVFRLADVACAVLSIYHLVYAEEVATTRVPPGNLGSTLQRNATDGRFGIWGHHLADLVLEGAEIGTDGPLVVVHPWIGS